MNRNFTPISGAIHATFTAPLRGILAHNRSFGARLCGIVLSTWLVTAFAHRAASVGTFGNALRLRFGSLFNAFTSAAAATRRRAHFCMGLVLCALLVTGTARGQATIIGNYPTTNDNTAVTTLGVGRLKAIKFTIATGVNMNVHSLKLRLLNALTNSTLNISIQKDDAGGAAPGSLHASFNNPILSDVLGDYTFTPAAPSILNSNTSYWILVQATNTQTTWVTNSPNITPTSLGFATFNEYMFSGNNGGTYVASARSPK